MWKRIIIDLIGFIVPSFVFGYLIVYFVDQLISGWKSNSKRKKWGVTSCVFVVVTGFLKYVYEFTSQL